MKPCEAEGCPYPARAKGLCVGHYHVVRRALAQPVRAKGTDVNWPAPRAISTRVEPAAYRRLRKLGKERGYRSLHAFAKAVLEGMEPLGPAR